MTASQAANSWRVKLHFDRRRFSYEGAEAAGGFKPPLATEGDDGVSFASAGLLCGTGGLRVNPSACSHHHMSHLPSVVHSYVFLVHACLVAWQRTRPPACCLPSPMRNRMFLRGVAESHGSGAAAERAAEADARWEPDCTTTLLLLNHNYYTTTLLHATPFARLDLLPSGTPQVHCPPRPLHTYTLPSVPPVTPPTMPFVH